MKSPTLVPVVISGGSGTRLWPRSRETRPKQFLPLAGSMSLFQQTLLRVQHLGRRSPIVVCNASHREFVQEQCQALRIQPKIVLEPVARNTAPAVALAALVATRDANGEEDPLLLVLPADHVIADVRGFVGAVGVAIEAAESGRLVTFGVLPDRPETGYGYILRGERRGEWAEVGRFVEKPDLQTARSYLASGEYSWNSGMFLFSASRLLSELRAHAPEILGACEHALATAEETGGALQLGAAFERCPADSIDYAVMEKTAMGAVVPLAAGWSDVGSWAALHDVSPHDLEGNTAVGDAMLDSCRNTYVSAGSRFVAALGLEDIVIVETEDAVLVLRRDRAQDVKKIVDELRARRRSET